MKERTYVEDRTFYILYAFGIVFFLLRIIGNIEGTWDEMTSQPEWIEATNMAQALIELVLVTTFIMTVIPRWVNKIKSTPLNKTVQTGCSIAGIAILIWGIQEFTGKELDFTESRIIGLVVIVTVAVAFWLFAYWYGKKYKNDEPKDKENEADVQDEQY